MTTPAYPILPGLDIKVIWRPRASNYEAQISPSGREVVVGAGQYPVHEFELIYNVLRNRTMSELEFKTYMGFWLQIDGILTGFNFLNPYDSATLASPIGATDGATTSFVLTRTFGAGGFAGVEPVGNVDSTQTFNLYVDGTLTSPTDGTYGYTLDLTEPWNQLLVFNAAPAAGHTLTVDMSYFYYCRFLEDFLEFEQVLYNVFQVAKVTLTSKKG